MSAKPSSPRGVAAAKAADEQFAGERAEHHAHSAASTAHAHAIKLKRLARINPEVKALLADRDRLAAENATLREANVAFSDENVRLKTELTAALSGDKGR